MLRNLNRTVYLINPALDGSMSTYPNDYAFPPLGIISLATAIKEKTNWNVKVFDGQITPYESIVKQMSVEKPAVVGLSVLAETYQTSLRYAEAAKTFNSLTLFGNDQAALLGKNIMAKKSCVDYICKAEHGENMIVPFLHALDNKIKMTDVPEMMYRENNRIITTTAKAPALEGKYKMDKSPIPDRSLLPNDIWDVYSKNYNITYGYLHNKKINGVTTINRGRGCPRAKNRCAYCGIMDLSIKVTSPEIFWNDVRSARNSINADVFYEVFDSMSSVPWWIRELVDKRPDDLKDVRFIVYAQAREVNEKILTLFKNLGAVMINMGLDSGDENSIRRLKGDKDSVVANKNAVELINKFGMNVFCSFVLGAPGETKESLTNTVNFTKWIADNKLACAIEAQPLMPRVQSKIGDWFNSPGKAELAMLGMGLKLKNRELLDKMSSSWLAEDIVDTPTVSRAYADIFCDVNYDQLVAAANEIVSHAKSKGIGSGSVGIRVD